MLNQIFLVGGFNPSEKYEGQLGLLCLWKNKTHVPNHQPVLLVEPLNPRTFWCFIVFHPTPNPVTVTPPPKKIRAKWIAPEASGFSSPGGWTGKTRTFPWSNSLCLAAMKRLKDQTLIDPFGAQAKRALGSRHFLTYTRNIEMLLFFTICTLFFFICHYFSLFVTILLLVIGHYFSLFVYIPMGNTTAVLHD